MDFDILIVGGGASGLAAAISAARFAKSVSPARSLRIGLLEKKEVPGKKLSATGNGRCNLSNAACSGREEVDGFFASIGLVTRTDEAGRMYPYGEEAAEVSALLTETALSYDVKIMTDCQVTQIRPTGNPPAACVASGGFIVEINRTGSPDGRTGGLSGAKDRLSGAKDRLSGAKGCSTDQTAGSRHLRCRILLLSMGGKSYSVFGTSGDGYGFARRLGHTVTRLAPSLVPIQVSEDLQGLAGVRTKADVTLLHLGKPVARETGEVQFNKDCLSGICIMNLSRLLVLNPEKPFAEAFKEYELQLDLLPEFSREEVTEILRQKSGSLQTLVKRKLAAWIEAAYAAAAMENPAAPENPAAAESLDGSERLALADPAAMTDRLKSLTFSVCGTKGWNDAQVTRGGVVLEEVDPDTMESHLVPGLYFAGEILNYDGPCGGFNLHFAWESGIRAGKAMAAAALGAEAAENGNPATR